MKAVLALIAILAIASATYTPNWKSCGTASDSWIPIAPTLDKQPARNTQITIHACGNVQDDVDVQDFALTAKLAGVTIYSTTVPLTQQEVLPGSQYCYDYSVFIPIIAVGSFEIDLELQDNNKAELGCLQLNFSL